MRVKYIINTNDDLALTMGKSYDVLANSEDFIVVYDDNGNICKCDIDSFEIISDKENIGVSKSQEQIKKEIKPRKEFDLERISHLVKTLSTLLENDCDDYELLSELSEEIYDRIFDIQHC